MHESSSLVQIERTKGIWKYLGLMFRKNPKPLFIELTKQDIFPINSLFVRVNFIAIWLDEDYKLVGAKLVKPNATSIKTKKPFKYLIEIPLVK